MGTFRITIEAIGPHHNGTERTATFDADRLAAAFVDYLKANGHTVQGARFELTGNGMVYSSDNLLTGERVLGEYRSPVQATREVHALVPPMPPVLLQLRPTDVQLRQAGLALEAAAEAQAATAALATLPPTPPFVSDHALP